MQTWLILIRTFYGLRDDFPFDGLCTRTEGRDRRIYFVAPGLYEILRSPGAARLKVVNTGLKLFEWNSHPASPCDYRLSMEGSAMVVPFMTRRIMYIPRPDFIYLLQHEGPLLSSFPTQPLMKDRFGQIGALVQSSR